MAYNRELSQFASLITVDDSTSVVGIDTFVGIGTTSPTSTLTVQGNTLITGITTTGSLSIGSTQVISSARQLQNIASLDATTTATIESAIQSAPNTFTDLRVTGISTFTNGPVFIGAATSTGTASQPLQVNGGAYFAGVGTATGSIGVGITNPQGAVDIRTSPQWSSFNYAANLVIGGTRNNGLGILDSTNSNPWAIANNSGNLIFAQMPALGNIAIAATEAARITTNRNLLIGSITETGTASQTLQVTGGAYVSGNLGVGNTNPTVPLVVNGSSRFFTSGQGDITISHSNLISNILGASTVQLALGANNTEVIRITAAGNVGIGTTSPTTKLDVSGIGQFTANGATLNLVGTDHSYIQWYPDGIAAGRKAYTGYPNGSANYFEIANEIADGSGHIYLNPGTNASVLIDSFTPTGTTSQPLQVSGGAYVSGNLGVGITNPGAKLDVLGDIRLSAADAEIEFNTGGARLKGRSNALSIHTGGGLDTETSEQVRINTTGVGIGTTNPTSKLHVIGDTRIVGTVTATAFVGDGSGLTNLPGGGGTNYWVQTAAGIHTLGNVGVGTTNPGTKLNVVDNSSSDAVRITQLGAGNAFVVEDSTNPDATPFVINAGGAVGVGTTNPTSQFHITGQFQSTQANSTTTGGGQIYLNGATGNRIDFNTNGVAAPAFTTRSAGTKLVLYPNISGSRVDYALGIESSTLWYSVDQSSSQHRWYAGTTQLADLKGSGELVIGSTSLTGTASQPLQVTGGAYVSGNLGIGTTDPQAELHVEGNAIITGILTATNGIQGEAFESYEIDLIGYTGYNLRTEETQIDFTETNDTTTDPYLWGTTVTLPIEDNGFTEDNTFIPFFNSEVVSVENPFRLMITVNGVLQSAFINNTDYVYQSNFLGSRNGYTIDSDNNIKFTESIPTGSDIVARVLPVSGTATKIKNYPFKPTDIVLGY